MKESDPAFATLRPATERLQQVTIPVTTPRRYITGLYALNLPSPEGTSGDWHDVFHWQEGYEPPRQVTLGGTEEINTQPIYGQLGIAEGKHRLLCRGLHVPMDMPAVYLANHTRAILDLLYRSLTRHGRVLNLTGATSDWLDSRQQGSDLLEHATRLLPHFPPSGQASLRRWIEQEDTELRAVYGA